MEPEKSPERQVGEMGENHLPRLNPVLKRRNKSSAAPTWGSADPTGGPSDPMGGSADPKAPIGLDSHVWLCCALSLYFKQKLQSCGPNNGNLSYTIE